MPSPSACSSSSSCSEFPLRISYCPANPCITRIVHDLHRQILDGVEGAELELNRYLTLCSFLEQQGGQEEGADGWVAHIVLDCLCGSEEHAIRMTKTVYTQQFRLGRRSRFLRLRTSDAGSAPRVLVQRAPVPLHIPLRALIPARHTAMQHALLPDLGASMRMVLQRRFFTDHSKKHWVKAAAHLQVLGMAAQPAGGAAHQPALPSGAKSTAESAAAVASKIWARAQTLSVTLLHDSLPCLKRPKRPQAAAASGERRAAAGAGCREAANPVDVAACINVLYGTILKLYSRGAKVPTFKARVAMTSRLMELSGLSAAEQLRFLTDHASLVRVCFMEYSLNALLDWLPCERELFLRTCPAMSTYLRIAGSMCDIFRQEAIITGRESWETLNRAAGTSIERCIRVCKFKVLKPVEPLLKCAHIVPGNFDEGVLSMPALPCLLAQSGSKGSEQLPEDSSDFESFVSSPEALLVSALQLRAPEHLQQALRSLRLVHENFSVHRLPHVVRCYQQDMLNAMHSACSARRQAAHRMCFCVVCAINGKGFQSKLRMCSVTGALSCITCQPGTVVTVNLLGAMIRLNCVPFYMCPCCTGLRVWMGDGSDFDRNECMCWQFGGARSAAIAAYNTQAATALGLQHSSLYLSQYPSPAQSMLCMVCGSKNTCPRARMILPSVSRRCMHRVNFCKKHAPPEHVLCTITSFDELEQVLVRTGQQQR